MIKDYLTPVIDGKMPEYVKELYPRFREYMLDYFRYLEQGGNILEVLEEWQHGNDPDNQVEPYIDQILKDLGWTWEGSLKIPKKVLLKNLRDFYLSRGTKKSFEFLFKALFNETVTIKYPRERMIVTSGADYSLDCQVFSTSSNHKDKNFKRILNDISNKRYAQIEGMVSGTVAPIEFIQITLSGGDTYLRISILEPITNFILEEDIKISSESGFVIEKLHKIAKFEIESKGHGIKKNAPIEVSGFGLEGFARVSKLSEGKIENVSITLGGESYQVGDAITAQPKPGDNGQGFFARVKTVSHTGEITEIDIEDSGFGYREIPELTVRTKSGNGASLEAISETIGGVERISTIQPYVNYSLQSTAKVGNCELRIIPTTIFKTHSYKDRLGVLGENCTIIDSDQYQQFSYDLVSNLPASQYRDVVNDLLHPVGYVRTDVTKIDKTATIGVDTVGTSTTKQGEQTKILGTLDGYYIESLTNELIGVK